METRRDAMYDAGNGKVGQVYLKGLGSVPIGVLENPKRRIEWIESKIALRPQWHWISRRQLSKARLHDALVSAVARALTKAPRAERKSRVVTDPSLHLAMTEPGDRIFRLPVKATK